jgi:ubiquitin C-terminal hydrolase
LVDFFKFSSKVEEINKEYLIERKLCLTSSFKILIDNLWPYGNKIQEYYCRENTNNKYFIPKEFKDKISKMDDLFKGVAANDSKDLVNFIIMTLHEELNEAPKGIINNNFVNNQNINLYNNNEVLQYFLNNFKKENSIISKEFYAVNHTLTKCSLCQLIKNNYQTYFFLIFPLEEIRKYKLDQCNKQMMNMCQNMFNVNPFLFQQNLQKMQNTNSVTLEDCFNYNEKIDTFQGQNAMYCNFCNAQLTSFYQTKLYTGPEILIIVLNRGKGIEFKVTLEFDLFIDITNYVELKDFNGWKYQLIGVVTHLGESGASGHFIAYCKSPIGGGWYQYNDELVFEVKNFEKEIRDYAMPYILFYQKINK